MKRLLLSSSVLATALLAVGAGAVRGSDASPAPPAASAHHVVRTIVYHARETFQPRILDIAKPAGPSSGDELVEKEILTRHGVHIGYDLLHFSVVTANRKRQVLDVVVDGVLVLRGGQVAI